ncbi:MAG: hypothetical protein M1818_000172 [Claussenomyces sp. TS43310]|nr:MAG: hypothetical protein M1818_000172 [Claussenomyces sp. TS43310]
MSLPPELRVLCHQLSATPAENLPHVTPTLLHNIQRCNGFFSSQDGSINTDDSEYTVLVHKLKTQLYALLYGKDAGGRFAAVVLIKAVAEVGGLTILRGVDSWLRGLLAVLGVSDAAISHQTDD